MLLPVILGAGAGCSALFSAFYSPSVWLPLGLVLVVLGAAAAIVRPPAGTAPVALALAGAAGLGLVALLSSSWAEAVEQSTTYANLWLAYAALLLLLLVLVPNRRQAAALILAAELGVAVVGADVLIRMLGSNPSGLFLNGRLNSPLGYINGQGCLFAMAVWPAVALAERRRPALAGAGLGVAVLMACLALLSQSRGAAIATVATALIALAAFPGFRRRILALGVATAGVAAAAGPILRVYSTSGSTGTLAGSTAQTAVLAIVLAALGAGLVWGLIVAATNRLGARDDRTRAGLQRIATVLAVLCIGLPILAGLIRLSSIEHTVSNQWHAFVSLSETANASTGATQSRLLSGSGNRYDYWRIAWHVFTAHPIAGVGAGNYTTSYYKLRHTTEAIQNPHSVELQTLSELGLIGALLLALLIGGVVLGAARLRRHALTSRTDRTLLVAASGLFCVWLVDTSGDWMHLLPGVTAVALAGAAVLCRVGGHDAAPGPAHAGRLSVRGLASCAAVAFVLVVAGASLLRSELVQRYVDSAQHALGSNPAAAINDAQKALRLDSENLDAYYVKAAGQARFDRASASRATLLTAAARDPSNFITWLLLGDLEVRLNHLKQARLYYGRAHALDPTDPSVATLATNPAGATSPTSGG